MMGSGQTAARLALVPDEAHFRGLTSCRAACPVQTDARSYVKAIARGALAEAYRIARAPNPLASICGRICGAPCEVACRRGEVDAPIAIRALKRAAQEAFQREIGLDAGAVAAWIRQNHPDLPPISDVRVAIIGSGPAGLAAAHDLALAGARVTVFEAAPVEGGMLALGIPAYRLPRDLVRFEIDVIRHLGVEFRCGVEIGEALTLPELRRSHEAVLIAVGARRSRTLDIPGIDAEGVLGGVDLLRDLSLGRPVDLGSRTLVIGGGNVAFDVARSVVRQTQFDVALMAARAHAGTTTLVCLEGREEMPADQVEIMEGEEEGVRIVNGMGPEAIVTGPNGRVRAVRVRQVLRVFDDDGRFAPEFGSGTGELECDRVLLAVGQRVDLAFVDTTRDGIDIGGNGAPVLDESLETTARNVWCAGDLAHGLKLAIDAVASGKAAARAIYARFGGVQIHAHHLDVHIPVEGFERERDYDLRGRIDLPTIPIRERLVAQSAHVEASISVEAARFEASRCLDCSVHTIFDGDRCVLCGGCVDICPEVCLRIVPVDAIQLREDQRVVLDGPGADKATALILKDETSCIRCGLCAARCPAGAITMERYQIGEVDHEA